MNKFLTKHEYKILFIVTTLFFLSMFFMFFSSKVSAADPTGELPYYVNSVDFVNADDYTLENLQEFYNNRWGAYYPLDFSSEGVIIFNYRQIVNEIPYDFTNIIVPNSSNSYYYFNDWSNPFSLFDYENDYVRINFVGYSSITFSKYRNQYNDPSLNVWNNSFNTFIFHGYNYPDYVKGDFFDNSYSGSLTIGSNIVITDNVPFSPDIPTQGHATPPINDTGHYIPGVNPQKPNITLFNPTTPNYPNVDNTNTDTLLESLISIVVYGFSFNGDRLKDSVNYITGTQSDLVDYIVDSINRAQNNIIGAIQDFADDFYNNMVSLFEPITQQLAYITQEVDADLITQGIENTSLHNDYSSIVGVKDTFVSVFTDTQEPETFVIPVHLEEISILNTPIQYIDLSIINPVKGILRTFAWVFTTFALVVTVLDSIPGYVNGGADE